MRLLRPPEVSGLVQPFEAYLREERMRGKATVKRYVAIVSDFADYLRRAHAETPLAAITHREVTPFLRETTTTGDTPSPTA
jgi:site-specific recombinase XerD